MVAIALGLLALAAAAAPAVAGAAPLARQGTSVNWQGNAWQGNAWQGNAWQGNAKRGFVAPGIGRGNVTCRPPYDNGPSNREPGGTQWVQLFPNDSTGANAETVMWTTRFGGPPSDRGKAIVRKAALLNRFYGPSFYEGMNTRAGRSVDPHSQGLFTGIISARNKTIGPDVAPPTTFTLRWDWAFANLGEGSPRDNRCHVTGNFLSAQPRARGSSARQGGRALGRPAKSRSGSQGRSAKRRNSSQGRSVQRRRSSRAVMRRVPGQAYDFSVNWQGQPSDPGGRATTTALNIPRVGTLSVSCPWALDPTDTSGSMTFTPAADNLTARGVANYTTLQGAGRHAATDFRLASAQVNPIPIGYTETPANIGSYHLPNNGMITGTLGVEPFNGGGVAIAKPASVSFLLSSEYVANDPDPADRFCHISGQVIAR